jgi:two-component system, sensor histidine kinase and response regulator
MTAVNLLIVDDKPENVFALEELLNRPGREVFKATSGNDALRLMLRHDFAVVLLDVEMPGMDGYETAELMRSAERTKLVPIIFVTAGDRSEERMFRGYAAGAVDFLYKPINARVLESKVDVFVDIYRKTRDLERTNAALARAGTALRERVSDLENVSRTLSHDLRAPLRSIRSFSTALADTLAGQLDAEAQGWLDRLVRASDRMAHMVDDLFALLQLSAVDQLTSEIDLNAVIEGVIENLKVDLEQAAGVVTHDSLPTARGHEILFVQILQNLIANAVKFTRTRPRAEIEIGTASGKPDEVVVFVKDNGVGFDMKYVHKLFGVFQRLHRPEAFEGTGIGLATVQRIVARHGGRVWAEGAIDGGATFYIAAPKP